MKKRALLVLFLCLFFAFGKFYPAQAGFGISPPYVKSNKILPGSHYEQKITLLRSSAEEDLTAEITINAPEISSWISIDKGEKFDLPKNQLQVPMIVRVDVPKNAAVGRYTGYINTRIAPKSEGGGGVAIALGARIDIDLNVTKETYPDFRIRGLAIPDFEELKAPWKWPIFSRFFYRVKLEMNIENTGNIKIAPSKVHLDVWDLNEKTLLESGDDTSIEKIEPYQTKTVFASFPTKLKAGQYWGKIKIYRNEEIVRDDKTAFTIAAAGSLPGGTKLGRGPYFMLFSLVLAGLVIIAILVKLKFWKLIFKILFVLLWPFIFAGKKTAVIYNIFRLKFWKWLHKKASGYSGNNRDLNQKDD